MIARRIGYSRKVIEVLQPSPNHAFDPLVIDCSLDDTPAGIARCIDLAVRVGHGHIVVDLGSREDTPSELLSVLHRSSCRLRDLGGKFAVVSRAPGVRRLLDLTLLSESFAVHGNLPDAVRDGQVRSSPTTLERAG